jgi:hypothetical protein
MLEEDPRVSTGIPTPDEKPEPPTQWRPEAELAPAAEARPETAPEPAAAPEAAAGPDAELVEALLREPEVGERAGDPPRGPQRRRRVRRPLLVTAALLGLAVVVAGGLVLAYGAGVGNGGSPGASSRPVASDAAAGSGTPGSSAAGPTSSAEATPAPTASPSTDLSPDAGEVVFSDDFKSGEKGWPTGSLTTLTTLSYSAGGYVIAASGSSTDHLIASPKQTGYQAIAVTVEASQTSGRGTAGFGVTCQAVGPNPNASAAAATPTPSAQASGSAGSSSASSPSPATPSSVMYEFIVLNNGGWLVERRGGSPDPGEPPTILMHGSASTVPGKATISVSGICATSSDGKRVRLALFIDGIRMTEFGDLPAEALSWKGGVVVTTGDVAATVTVTSFEERKLG